MESTGNVVAPSAEAKPPATGRKQSRLKIYLRYLLIVTLGALVGLAAFYILRKLGY